MQEIQRMQRNNEQTRLASLGNVFDEADKSVHNNFLVLEPTLEMSMGPRQCHERVKSNLLAKNVGQERHQSHVLLRKLETERSEIEVSQKVRGDWEQKASRMDSTTTILNSSEISDMNVEICFMRRSTLDSFPVCKCTTRTMHLVRSRLQTLSRVVMASVAMERLGSVMRPSMSKLHTFSAFGCVRAT